MNRRAITPRFWKIIRWIARIWSLLVFTVAILVITSPEQEAAEPIPFEDIFLLCLWGVAVLGLLIAWRWDLQGGLITIATLFVREIMWVILKGSWYVNFLLVWAFVVPPALLFICSWILRNRKKR